MCTGREGASRTLKNAGVPVVYDFKCLSAAARARLLLDPEREIEGKTGFHGCRQIAKSQNMQLFAASSHLIIALSAARAPPPPQTMSLDAFKVTSILAISPPSLSHSLSVACVWFSRSNSNLK